MIYNIRAIFFLILVIMISGCEGGGGHYNSVDQNPPPFENAADIDPDIITSSDPTSYEGIAYVGQDLRDVRDYQAQDDRFYLISIDAYLFLATYYEGLPVEIQVNPEFESPETALVEAERHAIIVGQLPIALRRDLETLTIHRGEDHEPFCGGSNNITIYTVGSEIMIRSGVLEEMLIHEGGHVSLDPYC